MSKSKDHHGITVTRVWVILILDNVRHLLVLLRGPDGHLDRPLVEVHLDVAVISRGNADVVRAVGASVGRV